MKIKIVYPSCQDNSLNDDPLFTNLNRSSIATKDGTIDDDLSLLQLSKQEDLVDTKILKIELSWSKWLVLLRVVVVLLVKLKY